MNLTDALDLVGALSIIAAVISVVLVFIPHPWTWPAALSVAGFLLTTLSVLISKRGAK